MALQFTGGTISEHFDLDRTPLGGSCLGFVYKGRTKDSGKDKDQHFAIKTSNRDKIMQELSRKHTIVGSILEIFTASRNLMCKNVQVKLSERLLKSTLLEIETHDPLPFTIGHKIMQEILRKLTIVGSLLEFFTASRNLIYKNSP